MGMFGVTGPFLTGAQKVNYPATCHIMGFVDLGRLPADFEPAMGGLDQLSPGECAIVQCAECVSNAERQSDFTMFKRLKKFVTGYTNGRVSHLTLWLAPVGAIVREVAVIPDIGGDAGDYFEVLGRDKWKRLFCSWLRNPEEDDTHMSDSDGEKGDVSADNYRMEEDDSETDESMSDDEDSEA